MSEQNREHKHLRFRTEGFRLVFFNHRPLTVGSVHQRAFGYAATMDSKDETPHYDDNGDQIGSTVGNNIGTDDDFGYNISL